MKTVTHQIKLTLTLFFFFFLSSCFNGKNVEENSCKIKNISSLNQQAIYYKGNKSYTAYIERTSCSSKKYGSNYLNDFYILFNFKKEKKLSSSFVEARFFIAVLNKYTKEIYHKDIYTLHYDTQHKIFSSIWKKTRLEFSLPKEVTLEDVFFLIGFQAESSSSKKKE